MRTLCRKSFAIGLLVAFLVVSTGRAVPVKAVGTTVAATAAAAFLATGVVYMSYLALTHADITIPAVSDLGDYLTDIGRKVAQYPSGAATYQELYERYHVFNSPIGNVIDGIWTWTQGKLKAFANDFSDTRIISSITAYELQADPLTPINGYEYSYPMVNIPPFDSGGSPIDTSWLYTGSPIVYGLTSGKYYLAPTADATYRNLKLNNGFYVVQHLVNGTWTTIHQVITGGREPNNGRYLNTGTSGTQYYYNVSWYGPSSLQYGESDIPLMPFEVIHDQATDEDLPMVIPTPTTQLPSWNDPDNDNRPIIPFVDIPQLPANITPPSGYTGLDQWGFNIEDLLDILADLGETIFDLSILRDLINGFAGLHGDNYYLEYNDGDTNYYITYQPTNYNNEYVTYNIDVSDTDEHLPVDLNTIQLYTQNRYVEQFKQSAIAGGSIIRDLVVFWYDVDPEIVYCLFGACILTLIGAFIGKWGHS